MEAAAVKSIRKDEDNNKNEGNNRDKGKEKALEAEFAAIKATLNQGDDTNGNKDGEVNRSDK